MKTKLPRISFEITQNCNLNCLFCYNHWKLDASQYFEEQTYAQAKKTLKKMLRMAEIEHITFTGGEPFMAKRFQELVLFTRMQGLSATVISNGTFADFSTYQQLADIGVSLFELPIHSTHKKHHDALTQVDGSWERTVETIEKLLELKTEVVVVIVLTKQNHKEVGETLDFIKSLGIERVMVNRVNLGGEGVYHSSEILMTREELIDSYQIISQKAKELELSISSNVCTPICVLNPRDYKHIQMTGCSSELSEKSIVLDYKGNIRFCNHSPEVLGNIFADSLESILQSEKALAWQQIIPEFCAECKAYNQCKAGCRAAAQQMRRSLASADPIIDFVGYDKDLVKKLKS